MNTEYVAALDSLKETLNNSNDLTSFASEFIKQYKLYKEVNGKEQNKEFTETEYERNFLREILLLLLERLGRDANEKGISPVIFQRQPKFCNIHSNAPVLESFFNKVAEACEMYPTQGFSCEYCETFQNNYFEEICKLLLLIIFVYEKIFYISTTKCFA